MKTKLWAVTVRYAAPGARPSTPEHGRRRRRHPTPEDFRRRTVVGPPEAATVEAVFDLLEISEDMRSRIRTDRVVRDFVEGKLVPDHAYPHHTTGMCYVNSGSRDEQLVEWDLDFVFVTKILQGDPS